MSQPLLFCAAYAAFCSFGQWIWDSPLSARRSRVCPPSGVSVNSTSRELFSPAAAPVEPAQGEGAGRFDGHDVQVHGGWLVCRPAVPYQRAGTVWVQVDLG